MAIGECRGPKGFDFVDCLKSCGELFVDYGGHKQAAGFSILPSRVTGFQKAIEEYCISSSSRSESVRPVLLIDGKLPLSEVSAELANGISRLAPFGEGNPPPLFVSTKTNLEKKEGGYVYSKGGEELFIRKGSPVGDWVNLSGDLVELDVAYSVDETGGLVLRDCRPSAFGDWPEDDG
jgi:single-stranded DNA-specific DHH superfamily exonuclease